VRITFGVESWILAYRRPTPQRQPHSVYEPYGPSFTDLKRLQGMFKDVVFLSPPREIDHNSQTVHSWVSLEKT
jgi:hypothetical protein